MLNTNQEKRITENQDGNILYKISYITKRTNDHCFATYHNNGIQNCSMFTHNDGTTNFTNELIELMNTYENENGDIDIENLIEYLDQIIISWQSIKIDKKLYDKISKSLTDEVKDNILNNDRDSENFVNKIMSLRSILKPDIMFEFEDNYLFFVTHRYDKIIEHSKENWMNYKHDYSGYKKQKYKSYDDFHHHYSDIASYECKFVDTSSHLHNSFVYDFRPKNH